MCIVYINEFVKYSENSCNRVYIPLNHRHVDITTDGVKLTYRASIMKIY